MSRDLTLGLVVFLIVCCSMDNYRIWSEQLHPFTKGKSDIGVLYGHSEPYFKCTSGIALLYISIYIFAKQ